MAHPKRKHSKSRTSKRRSSKKIMDFSSSICPNCGKMKTPHAVCKSCGYYKGIPVITIEKKGKE
jgi:large subunit ribosomal protein L32